MGNGALWNTGKKAKPSSVAEAAAATVNKPEDRPEEHKAVSSCNDKPLPLATVEMPAPLAADEDRPPTARSEGKSYCSESSSRCATASRGTRPRRERQSRTIRPTNEEQETEAAFRPLNSIESAAARSLKVVDPATSRFLSEVMENHFLFHFLKESEYKDVFGYMSKFDTIPGQVIFNQGDKGDSCYMIQAGTFTVGINGVIVKEMRVKQSFGELALLYKMERTATITSKSSGVLWKMDHTDFFKCMDRLSNQGNTKAMNFFNSDYNFIGLTEEDRNHLASVCSVQKFTDGQEILRAGEVGDWMFILISGKVRHVGKGGEVESSGSSPFIGSVGLMYGKQQANSTKAVGKVICLALSKSDLAGLRSPVLDVLRRSAIKVLLSTLPNLTNGSNIFNMMTPEQLHRLIGPFEDATFDENEVLAVPGDEAQFFLVVEGEVAIVRDVSSCESATNGSVLCIPGKNFDTSAVEKVLTDGMAYGEQEMMSGAPMSTCVIAKTRVRVHRVTHAAVLQNFGEPLNEALRFNEVKKVLQDIFLFKNLRQDQVDRTVRRLEQNFFGSNENIVNQGEDARHFYLIQSGTVCVRIGDKVLRSLGRWDYFGERGLLLKEKRSATCQALEDCVCLVLDADVFFEIVGNFKKELERRMHLQDLNISIPDLVVKAVVGRGTFGVVRLVHHRLDENKMYALKNVKKIQVVKSHQQKSIVMEREVNKQCYHPCIVQFIKTFQDKAHVCFLTEFLGGGDLFFAIREIGVLTSLHAQFFTGSITLGLEYLHGRGIMYRDLKPENVLLGFNGAAKLVDFGCCKKEFRTATLIGTPEYIAPEVIRGKGYTCAVDWWSLGVMLHEFVVGPLPFGADAEDQATLFKAILQAELVFPEYVNDEAVLSLIAGLLERKVERRIAAGSKGAKEIMHHPYFIDFNWDALAGGFFEPPWKPDAQSLMQSWEPPDGPLDDNIGDFSDVKGMEWAKGF